MGPENLEMPWLHHLFLHFPIALSAAAALFVLIGWVRRGDESWQTASRLTAYLAAVTGLLTIATGLASAAHFVEGGGEGAQVERHRNLALAAGAMLLLGATLTWRGTRRECGHPRGRRRGQPGRALWRRDAPPRARAVGGSAPQSRPGRHAQRGHARRPRGAPRVRRARRGLGADVAGVGRRDARDGDPDEGRRRDGRWR